jgi:hypothetical protein
MPLTVKKPFVNYFNLLSNVTIHYYLAVFRPVCKSDYCMKIYLSTLLITTFNTLNRSSYYTE